VVFAWSAMRSAYFCPTTSFTLSKNKKQNIMCADMWQNSNIWQHTTKPVIVSWKNGNWPL